MTEGQVTVSARAGIVTITIDNPSARNRLDGHLREDLLERLGQATTDITCRCIVVTGVNGVFCGGADIDSMVELHAAGDAEEIRRRVDLGGDIVRTIRAAPQPVIAAVDGLAAGAGVGLALACDIRLGSHRTRFAAGFVHLGLLPDWGAIDGAVRAAGRAGAADLLLSGDAIGADRSLALGLLQRCYHEGFDDEVARYAARIASAPPLAVAAIKTGIGIASPTSPLEAVLAFEQLQQPALFSDPGCGTALGAFVAARDARAST